MKMYAYEECYLDDAMCSLGEFFDYCVNGLGYGLNEMFERFARTRIAHCFEIGAPKYITGMSGVELAWMVLEEISGQQNYPDRIMPLERSREYWTGWVLAYYQWYRNLRFSDMIENGLSAEEVCKRYILHEAPLEKFVEIADQIIAENRLHRESTLKRLRAYYNMTQKQLSEKSGVSLRMIQLYEQGQNDISKAQAGVVLSLAQALGCEVRDLLA